jgi:uncharacterized protein YwqG
MKMPCIALSASIVEKNDDPLISKIDSIPYIDKRYKYPTKNSQPMICVAQLNMDHIFSLLCEKKSTETIRKYFQQYPQTGILQFYLPYSEKLTDNSDDIYIRYIEDPDIKNHDMDEQKKLSKLYSRYRKKHGGLFNIPLTSNDKNYDAYITDAVYAYDFLNSTMQNHPDWDEDLESTDCEYMDDYDKQDNIIHLGGFPYHLQDAFEFDENDDLILLSIINSCLGFNIGIKKDDLRSLKFKDLLFDLSY